MIKREIGEYKKEWDEIDAEHKLYEMLKLQRRHYLTSILTKSFYALHLKRWFNYFDSSSLMIINDEDLRNDPGYLIEKVQEFVLLPKLLLRGDYVKNTTTGKVCYNSWKSSGDHFPCLTYNDNITESTEANREALSNLKLLFKSHNEELYNMIGKRFKW